MHFKNDIQLGMYWARRLCNYPLITSEIRLICEDTLSFDLLCLFFENDRFRCYARDALHFALVAEYREGCFWEFLISDTFNMQSLFGLDQVDLIMSCMLILESLNHQGVYLPRLCYELTAARCVNAHMTPQTERFLRYADFVTVDFELTQMLGAPDDNESSPSPPNEFVP